MWKSMDSAPESDEVVILCYDEDGLYWLVMRESLGKDLWIEDNVGIPIEAIEWQELQEIPSKGDV